MTGSGRAQCFVPVSRTSILTERLGTDLSRIVKATSSIKQPRLPAFIGIGPDMARALYCFASINPNRMELSKALNMVVNTRSRREALCSSLRNEKYPLQGFKH